MNRLILFARIPELGQVKTRLAETLGEKQALDVYNHLLKILFRNLQEVNDGIVAITPDDGDQEKLGGLPGGWKTIAQGNGPLGERLIRAFEQAFAAGATRVVIIGADCPSVTASHIREAWGALAKYDLVAGPATDGGYWLIGLRNPQPELFKEIEWSSERVLSQTLGKASQLGLSITLLEILSDIDTEADWRAFQKANRAPGPTRP